MKLFRVISITLFLFMLGASASHAQTDATSINKEDAVENEIVVIETNVGNIELEMYRSDAPKTVENFVELAKKGYFDGVIFHRVISGFVIQGGDPTGTGTGGESIYGKRFEDEIDKSSEIYKTGYKRGVLAMANAGPNTNGSQFFICHQDVSLPPSYTIFGKVIDGMDTVDSIASTKTDPNNRPLQEIVMQKVYVKQ
ncbi:MAG: peptidylprolyl isomerase [Bacteroidetes bacterium]|nr:peptidylprolyl isomerase [Bacteroidota bacterium]